MGKAKKTALSLWHSLFTGMASADSAIMEQKHSGEGMEITQQVSRGGVFKDMLDQKVTDEVVEMRDKYYRVLREADKYDASQITLTEDEDGNIEFSNINKIKKKTVEDFMKHPPVYEEDGYSIRTIQDNKHVVNKNGIVCEGDSIDDSYFGNGLYDYQTTLTIERDNFIPRFEIDKFVTKMVSRNGENNRAHVDFYLPTIASQFGKIDAILIANINRMKDSKDYRSDIVDFKSIEWYSDKAWNSEDVCLFKYDDCHLVDIVVFDGSFVLTFDCNIVEDGKDLAEKYKTKELDDKYNTYAPKHNNIDVFTILRNETKKESNESDSINVNNLQTTTLKLS